ncbi:hypothetical protein D3C81_1151790 [compost metagenome]
MVFLQLLVNEVQCALPEFAVRRVEQHHWYQWAFAGLDQCQYFQRFIQGTEATRAQHEGIGFLDEEQLAGEEEVEGQQVARSVDGRIGMLLEGQGDVETEAVIPTGTFVGGSHDAAACASDDHQVRACQRGTEFPGHCIQRVFDGCACRAEHRDFAAPLELFEHAEGVLQFAQGLQGNLGIPAVVVFLGHAQHGQDHVAVDRDVRAVG